MKYSPRVTDKILESKLKGLGGLIIVGPKWCGKTTSAEQFSKSAVYLDDEEEGDNNLNIASFNPNILLEGATPRLIDEWQLAPILFDTARRVIDKRNKSGQFILTGSTTPPKDNTKHSGTGRFSYLQMYPMSLYESGESNGSVSLSTLFNSTPNLNVSSTMTVEKIIECILRGGWPGVLKHDFKTASEVASDYLYSLENNEWTYSSDKSIKHNPEKIKALIKSYARNTATTVAIDTILDDMSAIGGGISRTTADAYIQKLKSLFVIDDQPAWSGSLRSRTPLRKTPKRHLVDPSLAAAAIGATKEKLLRDYNSLGYLFESLCVRDMRVYSVANDASVFHYRDKTELEADIIIERGDGAWGAIEVKLGSKEEESAARNLITLSKRIDTTKCGKPSFLAIITGGKYPYRRDDGVYVIPIGCMAP